MDYLMQISHNRLTSTERLLNTRLKLLGKVRTVEALRRRSKTPGTEIDGDSFGALDLPSGRMLKKSQYIKILTLDLYKYLKIYEGKGYSFKGRTLFFNRSFKLLDKVRTVEDTSR